MEASPSPVYGAALLMRLGREALPGSNPGASAKRAARGAPGSQSRYSQFGPITKP